MPRHTNDLRPLPDTGDRLLVTELSKSPARLRAARLHNICPMYITWRVIAEIVRIGERQTHNPNNSYRRDGGERRALLTEKLRPNSRGCCFDSVDHLPVLYGLG